MHTSSSTHAISRNGYSQEQEIGRILLYRIPKEGVTSGAIWVSRLPIYGTTGARVEVMNPVLQKLLVGREEHKAKKNTERVQPVTHDPRYGSTREVSTSTVHQERSTSPFLAWIARRTCSDLAFHISKIQSTFENACVRDSRV